MQEANWGGRECEGDRFQDDECGTGCCTPVCHYQATLKITNQHPCGECVCVPGWAGPGTICGTDNDADGWSDEILGMPQNYQLI